MAAIMTSVYTVVRAVNAGVSTMGLDKSAMMALYSVRQLAPARAGTVASVCMLDQSTVSRHLKSLEERGLLTRTADPDDRRAQLFELTADGAEMLASLDATRQQRLAEALADWSPQERDELNTVISRLADSLLLVQARHTMPLGAGGTGPLP